MRSNTGYKGENGVNRFNILDVQRQIRFMNKVVIAVVPGWAVGGGHSLHVVCDMTIASKEHAVFKQTDADVTSFDGGFGSHLARQVGQKRAREIFSSRLLHLKPTKWAWSMPLCRTPSWSKRLQLGGNRDKSPTAIKMLKFGFNLIDDGLVGQQVYAGEAGSYGTEGQRRGGTPFEKRPRDFSRFPKFLDGACVTFWP